MYRKRLVDFYRHHNPDCLDSIDDILEIFKGREEELFLVLQEKYAGVSSASLLLKNSASPRGRRDSSAMLHTEDVAQALSYSDDDSRAFEGDTRVPCRPNIKSCESRESTSAFLPHAILDANHRSSGVSGVTPAIDVGVGTSSEECTVLREENAKLKAAHHALRCNVVILEAEKEALHRQKRDDEETMAKLRARIAQQDVTERGLIEEVCSSQLKGNSLLNETQFAAIISASQERLKGYYEERIAFMRTEMDAYYKHAAERIREKDAIIKALKSCFHEINDGV